MLSVRDAVTKASRFLLDMYSTEQCKDVRLEEVVLSDDDQSWLITLSFLREQSPDELASALGSLQREYKQITVNAISGAVRSMVMRSTHDV